MDQPPVHYAPWVSTQREDRKREKRCFYCGGSGHYQNNCHTRLSFNKKQAPGLLAKILHEEYQVPISTLKDRRRSPTKTSKQNKTSRAKANKSRPPPSSSYEAPPLSQDYAKLNANCPTDEEELDWFGCDENGKPCLNWHNGVYGPLSVKERRRRHADYLCLNCGSSKHVVDDCPVLPPARPRQPTNSQVPGGKERSPSISSGSESAESDSKSESDDESESGSEDDSDDEDESGSEDDSDGAPNSPALPIAKKAGISAPTTPQPPANKNRQVNEEGESSSSGSEPESDSEDSQTSDSEADTPSPQKSNKAIVSSTASPMLSSSEQSNLSDDSDSASDESNADSDTESEVESDSEPDLPALPMQKQALKPRTTSPQTTATKKRKLVEDSESASDIPAPVVSKKAAPQGTTSAVTHAPAATRAAQPQKQKPVTPKPITGANASITPKPKETRILPPQKRARTTATPPSRAVTETRILPPTRRTSQVHAKIVSRQSSDDGSANESESESESEAEPNTDEQVSARGEDAVDPEGESESEEESEAEPDSESPVSGTAEVKREPPLSQRPRLPNNYDAAAMVPFAPPHWNGMSTQDYVKNEPPPSQQPVVNAPVSAANANEELTPPESPLMIPRTPSPLPHISPARYHVTPRNQAQDPELWFTSQDYVAITWSEEHAAVPGRDTHRPPAPPRYFRDEVDAQGQLQNPITTAEDKELVDAQLTLQFTITGIHGTSYLLHELREIHLVRDWLACRWSFTRASHVLATYGSSQRRANAMRLLNGARMAQDVHIICNPYERTKDATNHTTFIIRTPIYKSRVTLLRAVSEMMSNGDMTVDYGLWTEIQMFHASIVAEIGNTANRRPYRMPFGIVIAFPTKFAWQDCFAEMEVDGELAKVEMEDDNKCGFCKRVGHRIILCDHYEKVNRRLQDGEIMTEHLELRDVV